jgi:hypothetical protein
MAERYLRVRVVREQAAVLLLRVDDAATALHQLPRQGPARVAVTDRLTRQAGEAMAALPPAWGDVGSLYVGPADVVTAEEAHSCGLVWDAEGGRVLDGQ